MAGLWVDPFKLYGTTVANLLNGAYAEAGTAGGGIVLTLVTDPDPTASGTVLKLPTSAGINSAPWGSRIRRVCTAFTTGGASIRVWMSSLPSDASPHPQPLCFTDSGNGEHVSVRITPTGSIAVYTGHPTTTETLIGESAPIIVANAWQRIEAKVVIHDTTGSVQVKVENVSVLTLSNKDTKIATGSANVQNIVCSNSFWGGLGAGPDLYVKDLAIWDSTGALNNDFLGNYGIAVLEPASDVSGTWTTIGGAGSAFASINETSPDDDTKYIYSPWAAATADVCTLTDLPAAATRVLFAQTVVRARKSDGGDGNLQVGLIATTLTANGADRPITTAYTYWTDISETDPDTSAAWAVAVMNAAKIRFDRTL